MSSLKKALYSLIFMAFAAMLYFGAPAKAKNLSWDQEAAIRKSQYAYIQACIADAVDSTDEAFHLASYASSLNPSDIDLASFAGLFRYSITPDSLDRENIYRMTLQRFFENPDDYENGYLASEIARANYRFDDLTRVWETLDSVFPTRQDVAPRLANAYVLQFMLGDSTAFDKAMSIYDRIERGTGKDIGLTSYKIRALQFKKDTAAIISEIESLLKAMPKESEAWLFAGQTYQAVGLDSVKELQYFTRACELDPTNGQAFVAMAEYYNQHNDTVAYTRELQNAILGNRIDIDTKDELLTSYLQLMLRDTTHYDEIRDLFEHLTLINPGEYKIHTKYGAFLLTIDDSAATEQFNYALGLEPGDENVRSMLIMSSINFGDTATAVSTALEGMKLNPDNFYFPISASTMLAQQGKMKEAFAVIDSVDISEVRNKQAVASFLTSAGDIYSLADSTKLAVEKYEAAIALDPNNTLAYNNASYLLSCHETDLDKALRYARYAVLSDIDNPTYLDTYAWAYFKLKNYPEAKSYIDKALRNLHLVTDSASTSSPNPMPDSVINAGKEESPVTELQIVEENGFNVDTSELDGDNPEENPEESYPGAAEVLEHAGDIYFMSGFPQQAVEFWQRALRLDPGNELLQRKVSNKTYFYE